MAINSTVTAKLRRADFQSSARTPWREIVYVRTIVSCHNIRMRTLTAVLSLGSMLLAVPLGAQTPTIDQSLAIRTVSSPRVSPDGRFIAYLVSEANWDENEFVTQIWIAMTSTGERYQLTHNRKSSSGPEWSPDSRRLAFLSDRDGKQQIWVISPTGGEAAQLTAVETGVGSFRWSPDGAAIAYTSAGPENKAHKDRKEKYGEFDVVDGDYTMQQLWTITPGDDPKEKPKADALTEGAAFSVGGFAWSPDSKRIAFSATRDPALSSGDTADIYVLRVSDKSVRKVVSTPGPDNNPIWSPDGTQIAYETANGERFHYFLNSHIAVVPADGGEPRVLNRTFDEDPHLIAWSTGGLYFEALQRTAGHLFVMRPDSGAVTRVSAPADGAFSGASFTRDFSTAVFTCAWPNRMAEICTSPVKSFSAHAVTQMGRPTEPVQAGPPRAVSMEESRRLGHRGRVDQARRF